MLWKKPHVISYAPWLNTEPFPAVNMYIHNVSTLSDLRSVWWRWSRCSCSGPCTPTWIISHIIKDLHKASVTTLQPHQRAWIKVNQTECCIWVSWAWFVKEERHHTTSPGFRGWTSHLYVPIYVTCWPVIEMKRIAPVFGSRGYKFILSHEILLLPK